MNENMVYVTELDEWMTQDEFNNYMDYVDFQIDSILEEEALRDFDF